MVLEASRHSIRPKQSILTEEKLAAIVPWQEVMSESEEFVLCRYYAV